MAFDPRLSSYQIPYQPLFESTRQQIQRSLFSLEQKLRRRRQMDLNMSPTRSIDPIVSVIPPPYYADPLAEMEKEREHRIAIEQERYLKKAAQQNQYLTRMEQLKFQRDQLARQAVLSSYHPFPHASTYPLDNPSDQELIRKYEDGSKAKQYYKDIKAQLDKQEQQQIRRVRAQFDRQHDLKNKLKDEIERQQQNYNERTTLRSGQKHKSVGRIINKQVQATPYDHVREPKSTIKKSSQHKNTDRKHLVKELKKEFDQLPIKQFEKSNKKHYQSAFKFPSTFHETNRTASPVRFLNDTSRKPNESSPYQKSLNKYKSLGKMPCNRSRMDISPNKTIRDTSYIQSRTPKNESKPSMQQLQSNAIKKIQNRLKLSKVIYQDSTFRNIKYQLNHLFNTYQVELKSRREIRDKINGHPLVLRRHSMVVQ